MKEYRVVLEEVCDILRTLETDSRHIISPDVDIITQLDFDSLKMLDLVDALNRAYGINFLEDPYSINDLRSPETIAAAVVIHTAPEQD